MSSIKSIHFFSKLYHGGFGLPATVWLYGFVTNIVANALFSMFFDILFRQSTKPILLFFLISLAYNLVLMSGIWEAAEKYSGAYHWVAITKCSLIIGYFIWFIGAFKAVGMLLILLFSH